MNPCHWVLPSPRGGIVTPLDVGLGRLHLWAQPFSAVDTSRCHLLGRQRGSSIWYGLQLGLFSLSYFWWVLAYYTSATGARPKRPRSPAWHRRQRAARAKARKRCKTGRGSLLDFRLLAAHHGSMPPKNKDGKAAGKTKSEERAPTTKLEFGYPADLTNALKAISDRATQDLWQSPGGSGGSEPTAEQIAQRHANMIHRLSKRIAGDVRAKEALCTALGQWTASLGHHLAALVARVRAISQKLDDDLSEACQEMQSAAVISVVSQEKITNAQAQLGPTWTAAQEQEVFRIAGALRAFGTVQPVSGASRPDASHMDVSLAGAAPAAPVTMADSARDLQNVPMSPVSMTSSMTLGVGMPPHGNMTGSGGEVAPEVRVTRWKRPSRGHNDRPGKSPRREVPPPWTSAVTGRTPEAAPRVAATLIDDDEELLPVHAPQSGSLSWFTSWLQVMSFAVNQGSDLIGELATNAEQDTMLPLHPDAQIEDATVAQAEALWIELVHMNTAPQEQQMDGLYARFREFLQMVRLCPNALPKIRQGLMLALQVTLGHVLDPYSYAPSTAQEWLYPSVLLEHGGPYVGYIPPLISNQVAVQVLVTAPCPFVPLEPSQVDGQDL